MNIVRKEFISALKKALPGIENGNVILEGADTFVFDNGFIHSYNDHISVSVPYSITNKNGEEVSAAVKAIDFYNLINKFTEDNIKLIISDETWTIKSGKAKAEIVLLNNTITEHIKKIIPNKIKWTKIPENFIEGISICKITGNKSMLSGIYVNDSFICSTDETRINWYNIKDESINIESFWISDNSADELLKLPNVHKYFVGENWINFKTEDNVIFSCKKLSGKFPFDKIKKLVESHEKTKGDISNTIPEKLIDAVNRAGVLSSNTDSFDTIMLTFNKEGIDVYSKRNSGSYSEFVEWDKPFKNDIGSYKIFVDYNMINGGIKYTKSFYLKKTENKEGKEIIRIIFTNPNGIQLISTFDGE